MGTIFSTAFLAHLAQRGGVIFLNWCKLLNLFILSVLKIPTFDANLIFKSHFWWFWQMRVYKHERWGLLVWISHYMYDFAKNYHCYKCNIKLWYPGLLQKDGGDKAVFPVDWGNSLMQFEKNHIKFEKRLKAGQAISEAKWGMLATQTRETDDFFLPVLCAADVQ